METLGLGGGVPPGWERHPSPMAQRSALGGKAGPDQDSILAVWGWETVWNPGYKRRSYVAGRGNGELLRSREEEGAQPFHGNRLQKALR